MYLDLGVEKIIRSEDIIAVIDKKSIESSTDMDNLLKYYGSQPSQQLKGTFKSIIITKKDLYFSPFTSNTIKKRSEQSAR